MKRTLAVVCLVAAGLVTSARPGSAQGVFVRLGGPSDTMVGAVPGAPTRIPVTAVNPYYYSYYCGYYYECPITYARLTFGFDPAKVQAMSAVPSGLENSLSSTTGTGTLTVVATGWAAGTERELISLRLTLQPGATDGGYVWVRVDSVASYSYVLAGSNTLVRSSIGQVCHASEIWGDVDENGRVDSRDALITLSAAVGLPVTGFPGLASLGDVDGDGLTNSRDALMMLSYAVDWLNEASRVGVGILDGACPAPSAPGETVVFQRTGTAAGLYRLDAASTTPGQITTNAQDWFPRLDASGQYVVFKCDTLTYTEVCRADAADGQHRRMLGPGSGSGFPDWSPDGGKIAFLQSGYLSLMDSSGANRVYLGGTPGPYGGNGVAWSRDGTRLAYGSLPAGTVRTVTLDTAHTVTVLDPSINDADQVRWSADGAYVLFSRSNWTIWSVSATGGTAQRLVAFQGGSRGFDVGPQGILFTATGPGGGNAVWLLKGGPTGPIVRLTSPPAGSGDVNPSFRRTP